MKTKTLISRTTNSFGFEIPSGIVVSIEYDRFSNLVKCSSPTFGVFYTDVKNLK